MLQTLKQKVGTLLLTPITLRKVVTVDYPRQSGAITAPTYTFRITVRAIPQAVKIAVDRGPWRSCRVSGTNWWYDWEGYSSGDHQLAGCRKTLPLCQRFKGFSA
jgi:hypothetical protein